MTEAVSAAGPDLGAARFLARVHLGQANAGLNAGIGGPQLLLDLWRRQSAGLCRGDLLARSAFSVGATAGQHDHGQRGNHEEA